MNTALLSSQSDEWCTPENVLERVRAFAPIEFDPCSNSQSIVGARWTNAVISTNFNPDGLTLDWLAAATGDGLIYCNPPYSKISDWISKCDEEALKGCEIIALVPARVDTRWFSKCWMATAICFWRGRLKFLGAPSSAPFPSALVYWGEREGKFCDVFSSSGKVVLL
jgi:hypothetical protein